MEWKDQREEFGGARKCMMLTRPRLLDGRGWGSGGSIRLQRKWEGRGLFNAGGGGEGMEFCL